MAQINNSLKPLTYYCTTALMTQIDARIHLKLLDIIVKIANKSKKKILEQFNRHMLLNIDGTKIL